MKKIGSEFIGLDWSPEDRADAVESPRAFSIDRATPISHDVAPLVSSLLEDAKFWEDPNATAPVDHAAAYLAVSDAIPEIEAWLQDAPAETDREAVHAMLDELRSLLELKQQILSRT